MQVTQVNGIMRPEGQTAAAMYWYLALAANLKVLSLSFMNEDTAPVWLRSWSQVIQAVGAKLELSGLGARPALLTECFPSSYHQKWLNLPRGPHLGPRGGLSACALSPPLGPPGFLAPLLPFSLSAREPAGPGAENTDFPGNLWPSLIPDQAQL